MAGGAVQQREKTFGLETHRTHSMWYWVIHSYAFVFFLTVRFGRVLLFIALLRNIKHLVLAFREAHDKYKHRRNNSLFCEDYSALRVGRQPTHTEPGRVGLGGMKASLF